MENRKPEIHKLIDSIEGDTILQMVEEDSHYYTSHVDIVNDLNSEQL